jgi:hypothetical protein
MMQQSHTTLSNGLQSFADVSPDYELAPIGIGSIRDQAEKLAEYGRNGDIYIVHAAEGETVVPMEVLQANPKVRELLFDQMRDMGMDPDEFVVGNELNSINPTTGMPEFFFKKIFRSVKKAVKKVVGFAKKAAPIVLPIALSAFGVPFLGPAFGAGTFGAGFVGGALGGLSGGQSLKSSLKSGLISGGIASLTGGLKGAFGYGPTGSSATGVEGFKQGLGQTVGMGPPGYINPTPTQQADRLLSGDVGEFLGAKPYFDPNVEGAVLPPSSYLQGSTPENMAKVDKMLNLKDGFRGLSRSQIQEGYAQLLDQPPLVKPISNVSTNVSNVGPAVRPASNVGSAVRPASNVGPRVSTNAVSNVGSRVSPNANVVSKAAGTSINVPVAEQPFKYAEFTPFAKEITAADVLTANNINPLMANDTQLKMATKIAADANPGMLKQYGAAAALGAGALLASGALDAPEPEPDPDASMLLGFGESTGMERYQQNPENYQVAQLYTPEQAARLGITNYDYDPRRTMFNAAQGGLANLSNFPRRTGSIRGPGTERSDDIPAMLSDGEFVMTSKAVRGASPNPTGNKERDRRNGAKNMYAMMRNFEMRA